MKFAFPLLLLSSGVFLPSAAHALEPGDVMVVGYDSTSPDSVAFVAWVELPANETITIADTDYSDGGDGSGEGAGGGSYSNAVTMDWTNTTGNPIPAGTVILVNDDGSTNIGSASGSLPLTLGGEQFFLVQGSFDDGIFTGDLLFGLDYEGSGGWGESGESDLPNALNVPNGNLSFPDEANYEFSANRTNLPLASFREQVSLVSNWDTPSTSLSTAIFEETGTTLPEPRVDLLGEVSKGLIFHARRLNNKLPVIDEAWMLSQGATVGEADNINGASCIRVPSWVLPQDRPDPSAQYYLYFANHSGDFIRMAWAENIGGPWTGYRMDSSLPLAQRGVLSLGDDGEILPGNNITIDGHIASPQVFVDDVNQRFIMYYHGPAAFEEKDKGQSTAVATSADGLNFNLPADGGQAGHGTFPVILGESYFRVFQQAGNFYALSNTGDIWMAPDPQNPFTPAAGYDYSRDYWDRGPNPFVDEARARGWPELRPRHFAVHSRDNVLYAFLTYKSARPERVKVATFDFDELPADYDDWEPDFPDQELLRAEEDWEGAQFPALESKPGADDDGVNELRDPAFFQDTDGRTYLFYSGQGEDAIGLARLVVSPQVSGNADLVRGQDETFQVATESDVSAAIRRISYSSPVVVNFDGESDALPFAYRGNGNYPVLQNQTVADGTGAFQLAHLSAEDSETLTFTDRYYAQSGASLQFRSRRASATEGQVSAVQVSFDGALWQTIWIQTTEAVEASFRHVIVDLSGLAGRAFNLRFLYEHDPLRNPNFEAGAGATEGWFFDSITAAGLEAVEVLDEQAFTASSFTLASITSILDPYLADGTGSEDRFLISMDGLHAGSATGFGKPFVIRVKTSYEQFLDDHFTESEQDDLELASELADPDNDQLSNLLEHVFGSNPRIANGGLIELGQNTEEPSLRFPWNPEANFSYQLQLSDDLNNFEDIDFTENVTINGTLQEVTVTQDPSVGDLVDKAFFRLKIAPQ